MCKLGDTSIELLNIFPAGAMSFGERFYNHKASIVASVGVFQFWVALSKDDLHYYLLYRKRDIFMKHGILCLIRDRRGVIKEVGMDVALVVYWLVLGGIILATTWMFWRSSRNIEMLLEEPELSKHRFSLIWSRWVLVATLVFYAANTESVVIYGVSMSTRLIICGAFWLVGLVAAIFLINPGRRAEADQQRRRRRPVGIIQD